MSYISSLTDNFTLSWDLGIVVFLFFAAFFYGLSVGAKKLGVLLASTYFASVIFALAPYVASFTQDMPDYRKLIFEWSIFGILTFGLFFLLAGSILRSSLALPPKEDSQLWHTFLLSIVTAGFFTTAGLALLPEAYYDKLSTITKSIFVFNNAHFWWAVGGICALIIIRKGKKS